jgi:hypothetical protein
MNSTRNVPGLLSRYLPILTWGAEYSRRTFTNDLIVGGSSRACSFRSREVRYSGEVGMNIQGQPRRSARRVNGGIRS